MSERLLPQDIDAERMVLSAFMRSPKHASELFAERGVNESWFHMPAHVEIFRAVMALDAKGAPVDFITVTDWLRTQDRLEEAGGASYVTEIADEQIAAVHLVEHLNILEKKATLRQIIMECTAAISAAYGEQEEPVQILDQVESQILQIRNRRTLNGEESLMDAVREGLALIQKSVESRGAPTGWRTPFEKLDLMTDGMHPTEVTMLAGAPSVGKTALGMQIMEYITGNGVPGGILTLEMGSARLMQRTIMAQSGISMQKIRMGLLEVDYQRITRVSAKIATLPLRIDKTEQTSILALRAKLRRWKRNHGTRVVMIDNLSLMRGDSKRARENRRLEVEEITNGLKSIAKELDMHLIPIVHIGREAVKAGRRPRMQDMKESSSIEQDADNVWILHRPEAGEDNGGDQVLSDNGELIAAKTRSGPTGFVPVRFVKELARFVEITDRPEPS